MGSPIVNGLKDTFRYLPQHAIEGVFGRFAPQVEGFLGMSPAQDGPTLGAAPVEHPDMDFERQRLERANKSFLPKPDVTTMRKPLPKGK